MPPLERVGQALYGPQWQSALARALGVNDRTMRRWVAGDSTVPPGIREDLKGLVETRLAELDELLNSLITQS